jgi:ankyrin repeat protein
MVHKRGFTALISASLDIVCELLKHDMVEVNAAGEDGESALIAASSEGHFGNKINENITNKRGETALTVGSLCGHFEIIHELLNYRVIDVNSISEDGKSPHLGSPRQKWPL